jgi:hypothetical protein
MTLDEAYRTYQWLDYQEKVAAMQKQAFFGPFQSRLGREIDAFEKARNAAGRGPLVPRVDPNQIDALTAARTGRMVDGAPMIARYDSPVPMGFLEKYVPGVADLKGGRYLKGVGKLGLTGLGAAAAGYGGYKYLTEPGESKQAAYLGQVTAQAFHDEMQKLAFFGPKVVNIYQKAPETSYLKPLALLATGGIGTILAKKAYEDWAAGRQMRSQMGG